MERSAYLRAAELDSEIDRNEESIKELTSWIESERFEGVALSFVNENGIHTSSSVILEGDLARDITEYTRRKIRKILGKQIQEFKKL